MKAIRTKEVNENVKAANSCLRKAKWQAKELAVFTGEVVRLMDKEGHSLQGFFNRVEFVLVDGTIKFRVVINPYYNSSIGQPYKNMQTVWYHYKADKIPFGASLLFMNLGLETGNQLTQDSHTRYLQTMGTYLTYKNSGWNLDGAFYYQTGKNKDAESVSAFMASATAAYAFNKTWGMVVSFDYLSGNEEGSSKFKAFDPLYGTHHKFYGSMDYFYASAFNKGFAPGLIDGRLGARFRASAKVDMELNYHYFATATEVDFKEDLKKSLGSEVDYQINWSVMKDVKLSAGYSFMLGTKTMDAVKGGNHKSWQDWGWVSVNINPKVFFTKW